MDMQEMEHRLTSVEDRAKSNTRRLDEVENNQENLRELVGTVKVLADREARVETDVQEIKRDVKNIRDKPAKRWETLVTEFAKMILAAIVGFVFAKIGL